MSVTMTKFGDWTKAGVTLRNLHPKIESFAKERMREDAEQFVKNVQNKIDTQMFNKRYPPLADSTIHAKGSDDFYKETEDLRDGFGVRNIKSREGEITVFAGASPWKTHKPSGMKMSDLMITLEYGNGHIPPRPLIRPTWDEMSQECIDKWLKMNEKNIYGGLSMDTSAWFEQIDKAWIDLIIKTISLPDTELNVFVRTPDKDFEIERYPSVSVYGLYTQFDKSRYYSSQKNVNIDHDSGVSHTSEKSKPFKLNYQLDFWSIYKTDMNLMSAQWLSKYVQFFNLPIEDASGNERTLFVRNRDSYTPRDYFEKKERIFHSTITYEVWGDLDAQETTVDDIVENFVLDINKGD